MQESTGVGLASGIERAELSCGMQVLVEHIDSVRSVGLTWLLPVGLSGDPEGALGEGESVMLSELILRGSAGRSSRDFGESLDQLGVSRRCTAANYHTVVSATMLGSNVEGALPILAGMIRDPTIAADAIEPVRALAIASIEGLDDSPGFVAAMKMQERALPWPYNRSGMGTMDGLRALTREGLHAAWHRRCCPGRHGDHHSVGGSIISLAGDVKIEQVVKILEPLLSGWVGVGSEPAISGPRQRGSVFKKLPTEQTQICLGFEAPPSAAPDFMAFRLATEILGGGMSSRLFTEVREKRSLCYSVGASQSSGRDFGLITVHAGSTAERANETLECIDTELRRIGQGVTRSEFERAKIKLKSAMVMSGESTSARALSMARDAHIFGRPRSLAERSGDLDRVNFEEFNLYLPIRMSEAWLSTRTLSVVGQNPL